MPSAETAWERARVTFSSVSFSWPAYPFTVFDEIGNQIVAALELDVDLRPGILDAFLHRDEGVVHAHQPGNDQDDNG